MGETNPQQGAALNSTERALRNKQIATQRACGDTWAEIAARHGISERQARRSRTEHITSGGPVAWLEADPNEVLREAVDIHREVLSSLAAAASAADNSAAQVGALRARATTALQLVNLLAQAGLVPDSAGAWRFAREVTGLVAAVVAVAERQGLDVETIIEEFDRIIPRRMAMAVAA